MEHIDVEVAFFVIETEVLYHVVGSNLTEESVALEENENSNEVSSNIIDLSSNRSKNSEQEKEENGQVDNTLETHGRWVIGEEFPGFIMILLEVFSVEVVVG